MMENKERKIVPTIFDQIEAYQLSISKSLETLKENLNDKESDDKVTMNQSTIHNPNQGVKNKDKKKRLSIFERVGAHQIVASKTTETSNVSLKKKEVDGGNTSDLSCANEPFDNTKQYAGARKERKSISKFGSFFKKSYSSPSRSISRSLRSDK